MRRRIAALIGTLATAFAIVLATASPAAAYEINYATDVDWNTDYAKVCTIDTYVFGAGQACVQPTGDDIWVKDNDKNGYQVAVYWDDLNSARAGKCVDDLGVDKAWVLCNKDWTEGHTIRWRFAWETASGWVIPDAPYWDTKV
ncbi:hypothetical protein [Glycomyces sp. NPDC047010]|uniref:hypothetical protein n=1 Tax=Glycomyces sp. NPDC047010 TaxID=3155023 RepID=UPI0033E2C2E7